MSTVSMITIPSTNKSSFPCKNLTLNRFLPSSSSFVSLGRKPSFSCTLFLQKKSKTAPIFKTHVSAQDVVEATEDSIPPLLQDNQVCILSFFFSFSLKWVVQYKQTGDNLEKGHLKQQLFMGFQIKWLDTWLKFYALNYIWV